MAETYVKGLNELQRFLDQLPAKVERNILRSALRAGANVVREEAVRNVPRDTGALAASLKVGTRARRGMVTANVRTKVFYAKFIEYGTKPHYIPGPITINGKVIAGVDHPGIVSPKPFLRPALDTRAQAAVLAAGEQIKRRLTKAGLDASHVTLEGDE